MRPLAVLPGVLAALFSACTETYERCADGAVAVSANPLRCARDAAADAPTDACVATDEPGDGADSNCDGVDGIRGAQIYVSGERGDDTDGNGLAPDRPLRTLTAALRLAAAGETRRVVLLGAGDYPYVREADAGTVVSYQLRVPLRLHGGYGQDFTRRSGESVVRAAYVAVVIEGTATDAFVLSDLTLRGEAPSAPAAGESVFGLGVLRAGSVRLQRVNVFAARGAPGSNGAAGSAGAPGSDATNFVGAMGCRGSAGGNGGNGEGLGAMPTPGSPGGRGTEAGDANGGDAGALGTAATEGGSGDTGGVGDRGADGVPVLQGMLGPQGYAAPDPVPGRPGRAGGGRRRRRGRTGQRRRGHRRTRRRRRRRRLRRRRRRRRQRRRRVGGDLRGRRGRPHRARRTAGAAGRRQRRRRRRRGETARAAATAPRESRRPPPGPRATAGAAATAGRGGNGGARRARSRRTHLRSAPRHPQRDDRGRRRRRRAAGPRRQPRQHRRRLIEPRALPEDLRRSMSPALPTPRDLPTGLDRCAEALVAGSDVVVLAGGEGARRLYTRVAALVAQTGAEVTTLVADNDAGATALGEAAAGARVALLASGPEWTPRTLPSLRALARVRRAVQLVVPAHGDETGEDLPVDELADATRLLDAPLCVGLVARAEQLGAATAAMSLHARDMGRPCATVFSLHNVGLRRLDGPPEPCEVGSAVSMLGDVGAPFAVLGAGEDLAPVLARAKSAGVGPLRAVRVDRLRPGLLPALTEALQGVQTVWVLESLPGVLGDEGWLTLLTHRATQGSARVVPVLRGHDEALFALDEPDARDLTLLPLPRAATPRPRGPQGLPRRVAVPGARGPRRAHALPRRPRG
jgi:hypothetical protein